MTGGAGFSGDSRKNLENNERLRTKERLQFKGRGLKSWPKVTPNLATLRLFRRSLRKRRRRQHLLVIAIMFVLSIGVLFLLNMI